MSLTQLQPISVAVAAAFRSLRLPRVVVTQDQVTNKVEVDLLENVVDEPKTDKLKSSKTNKN